MSCQLNPSCQASKNFGIVLLESSECSITLEVIVTTLNPSRRMNLDIAAMNQHAPSISSNRFQTSARPSFRL